MSLDAHQAGSGRAPSGKAQHAFCAVSAIGPGLLCKTAIFPKCTGMASIVSLCTCPAVSLRAIARFMHALQVQQLLEMGADADAKDKRGISALHYASGQGRLEVLQFLWSRGLDLDADDPGIALLQALCHKAYTWSPSPWHAYITSIFACRRWSRAAQTKSVGVTSASDA